MNGHQVCMRSMVTGEQSWQPFTPARSGLLDRQVVLVAGDFVTVREQWDASAPDFPMCLLPRGTAVPGMAVQREVPMYRAEAIRLGLIR